MESQVVLVVAPPGPVRDGLRALISVIPGPVGVVTADDGPAALKAITAHRPVLVVLDTSLSPDEVEAVLAWLKAESPASRCLVLADVPQDEESAWVAGADEVLLKWVPAATLLRVLGSLLAPAVEP